jgi:hypothetical protein
MKFGVREICNVVFRAKAVQKIGNATFQKGQPVLYIDSAKTSTLEGAATTVYAQGGRGNVRLVSWEGEKTLTFTVEDALISPISFAMLSGAGVIKGTSEEKVHVHMTTTTTVGESNRIDLSEALGTNKICDTAPIFIMGVETGDGSLDGSMFTGTVGTTDVSQGPAAYQYITLTGSNIPAAGTVVMVDYYITKSSAKVTELQIDAQHFGGYYYVEADTLFRAQKDGQDYPANITLPNVKIQSNWTFTMASSGDPSTFTFTMDAMPGYTYFDQTKKVLCVIQVVEDIDESTDTWSTVMGHKTGEETYITSDDVVPYDSTDNVPGVNEQYTKVAASAEYSSSTTYYYKNGNIYKAATDVTDANFSTKKGSLYTKNI